MNEDQEKSLEGMSDSVKEAVRRRVDERGLTLDQALEEVLLCGPQGNNGAVA